MTISETIEKFYTDYPQQTDAYNLYNTVSLAARRMFRTSDQYSRWDANIFVAVILKREFFAHFDSWPNTDWLAVLSAFFGNVAGAKMLRAWHAEHECELLWALPTR